MWKFTGNINGIIDSVSQDLPMVIQNFTLVPRPGSNATCNVYLIKDSRSVWIAPFNNNVYQIYTDEIPRLLEAGEKIRLATSGSVDYLFNIENVIAP